MPDLRLIRDPLSAFNFDVILIDTSSVGAALLSAGRSAVASGFSECSGLDASLEVLEFREGGVNDYVHKFPTRASFANIVLRHGVIPLNDQLWHWMDDAIQGKPARRNGVILLRNERRLPIKAWNFKRGLPLKWTGPVLNATQNTLAVESIEIAHEGLTMPAAVPI